MTVTAEDPRKEFAGNGVTVDFTICKVYDETHVVAYLVEDADPTNVATWVLTTDFTVSNVGAANATLTAVVAPASGYTLVTNRSVPYTQDYDYTANDDFPADSHETALDLDVMRAQQLNSQLSRTLRLQDADISGASVELPIPEASLFLCWNETADGIINFDIGDSTLQTPADASVTLAKMASISQYQMYMRTTAGSGAPELISGNATTASLLTAASAAAMRTVLGLGTIATQDASGVSITGGTIGASVTLSGLTADAVYALLPDGALVASAYDFDNTRKDITAGAMTAAADDGTTPLITEGTDLGLLVAHACKNAFNWVKVTANITGNAPTTKTCFALFAGSTCIGVKSVSNSGNDGPYTAVFWYDPASSSSINYTVRVSIDSGTFELNQNYASNNYGSMDGSTLTVEEYKQSS